MLLETKAVTLKTVAERVGLAPCSVSAILNNTEASRAIPQRTKDRVYRAASELNYRPNYWARSLRTRKTRMVAVLAPGFGRSAVAQVVAAAQRRLHREGYLLVLITSDAEDGGRFCAHLQQRGIEGLISVDVNAPGQLSLPVVSVAVDGSLSEDSSAHAMQEWLLELGESAACTVIGQIENPDSDRRTKVEAKIPPAFFEMPAANLSFAARAESA
jgi:transcriptional regulator with XRE-family HTH domain